MKLKKNDRGVTLMELIIVLIIITTLALLVAPKFLGKTEEARRSAAITDIQSGLGTALDLYEANMGEYPGSLEDLVKAPDSKGNWRGPYIKSRRVPKDPWGRPYIYKKPGDINTDSYDLVSYGRDGKPGGQGYDTDIGNW